MTVTRAGLLFNSDPHLGYFFPFLVFLGAFFLAFAFVAMCFLLSLFRETEKFSLVKKRLGS